jgi:hypothetical protein
MKHHRLVSKTPQLAQSNFEAKVNFKVELTADLVQVVFNKTS